MDWIAEWKKLQDQSVLYRAVQRDQEESYWAKYALNYDDRRCWGNGLSKELETIRSLLDSSMSVLEIGAGTGALTLPTARIVKRVTAVEPSPSMIKVLEWKLERNGVDNVHTVNSRWEDAEVEPHDVVLAVGCLYVFYDISDALGKMLEKARKGLILTMGSPRQGQLYKEAATVLRVSPPSMGPDFVHLYNVLCQLGIYANVNIVRAKRSLLYENLEHAMDIRAERMELPEEKLPQLKDYLKRRLSVAPSGEFTLGEIEGVTAIIWHWKNGLPQFSFPMADGETLS